MALETSGAAHATGVAPHASAAPSDATVGARRFTLGDVFAAWRSGDSTWTRARRVWRLRRRERRARDHRTEWRCPTQRERIALFADSW